MGFILNLVCLAHPLGIMLHESTGGLDSYALQVRRKASVYLYQLSLVNFCLDRPILGTLDNFNIQVDQARKVNCDCQPRRTMERAFEKQTLDCHTVLLLKNVEGEVAMLALIGSRTVDTL